ncbi:unnamed protein product [Peniophora sp. CBMAI 1063]|nr:unnamed protein product [Peniophora sp. CBMAI 1063]
MQESQKKELAYLTAPKYNHYSVNDLPNELLAAVFVIVRDACIEDEAEHGVPGWAVSLTHTCSRWRAVALATQLLWTLVPRHISLTWQQVFIQRAGDAPLGLSLHFPASANSLTTGVMIHRTAVACLMVQKNLRRMTALWLLFDSLDFYPASWSQFLGVPAPELRAFRMDAVDAQAVELPRDLFQRHAPKLKSINLDNIYFTWPSLAFPELSMLEINHSDGLSGDRDSGMGTHPELLNLLAALPKLQWLELHGFHYSPSPSNSFPSETVSLPQIKVVRLHAAGELVIRLLQNLRLPSSANIFLGLTSTPSLVAEHPESVVRYLKAYFHAPPSMTIKFAADEFCIQLMRVPTSFLRRYSALTSAPLTIEYKRPEFLYFRSFAHLAYTIVKDGLTFSHLTSLHVESALADEDPLGTWTSILRYASALERLSLKGTAIPEICLALSAPIGEERTEGERATEKEPCYLLPSLQWLSLWDVSFDSLVDVAKRDLDTIYWDIHGAVARDPDTMSDPEEEQADLLEWIWDDARFDWISALKRRAGGWKILKEITLEHCSGLPDWHWEEYLFGEAALRVYSDAD